MGRVPEPHGGERTPRWSRLRDAATVALVVAVATGWALTPDAVRHQAGVEPLLHETVEIERAEPAGGRALRVVAPAAAVGSWGGRFIEVLEDGRPLERARPQAVRREGDGRYSVAGAEVLFAPSASGPVELIAGAAGEDRGAAAAGRYAIRRPAEIAGAVVTAFTAAFAALNLAAAILIASGLVRSGVLRGSALAVALALAGWMAAQAALDEALRWTGSDLLGQKMALLLEEVDAYEVVFLGSSRVYRQLDPRTFDSVFAEAGRPIRSFNLGAPDMRMLEVLFLARWLLDVEPDRLELLVVDAESEPLFIREENLASDRIVRWHDARNFLAIAAEAWRVSPSVATALYTAGRHARPFAHHVTQIGRGLERVRELRAPRPPEAPPEQRGFYAGDEEMVASPYQAQREELELFHGRLHEDLGRWHRDVERLRRSARAGELTDRFEIELFGELRRIAERRGVRVVFLLDARPEETPNLVWAAENGVIETLLRFDDPERYAQLYDPALRFDRHHVSKAGARLYTEEVARRILETQTRADLAAPRSRSRPTS